MIPLRPPSSEDRDERNHAYALERDGEVHEEGRRAPHGAKVLVIGAGGEGCAARGTEGKTGAPGVEAELGGYYARWLFKSLG